MANPFGIKSMEAYSGKVKSMVKLMNRDKCMAHSYDCCG